MFDQESANTVKVLRPAPNDQRDYKPDEKSRTAWELATHLASIGLYDCQHQNATYGRPILRTSS